jgi:hypothetical protein
MNQMQMKSLRLCLCAETGSSIFSTEMKIIQTLGLEYVEPTLHNEVRPTDWLADHGMHFGLQFGGSVFSLNLGPILVIFKDIFKTQPLLSKFLLSSITGKAN